MVNISRFKTLVEIISETFLNNLLYISYNISRTVKKHKTEMGMYKTEGKLHDNRPYWVLVNGPVRYIYWYKTHKTWYLSDRLGSTSGELHLIIE